MANFLSKAGSVIPGLGSVLGETPQASVSGAFPGLGELGGEYSDFLLRRLQTPTTQSEQFQQGSQAIRDALTTVSATTRQRLGDVANTRGSLDAGANVQALLDIGRGESQAFAMSINDLFQELENRREQNVLGFLSAGASEATGVSIVNAQLEMGNISQDRDEQMRLIEHFAPGAGSMGGGGSFGCWVARAIYGESSPKWLLAREYIFNMAPKSLRDAYMRYGPALAEMVKRNVVLKEYLRPVFDSFVREAAYGNSN